MPDMANKERHELRATFQLTSDGCLVNLKEMKASCDSGHISGIATFNDNVMVTDSQNKTVSIYDDEGNTVFIKKFQHNVWDCAHLRKGSFALLSDDSIKLFTQDWAYYRKIRVGLRNPRQLVVDSDDFFVVADALCEHVAVYHAKSGQLVSAFTTTNGRSPASPTRTMSPFTLGGEPVVDSAGTGITINSQDLIYIAGRASGTVHVFSHYGAERVDLQPPAEVADVLSKPVAMCFDKHGNIFLADRGTNEVMWISSDWSESEVVLSERQGLSKPVSVALTSSGSLVVADQDSKLFLLG